MEADYNPNGWLGPLCVSILWYDFSTEDKFEDGWKKTYKRLKQLLPNVITVDPGLQTTAITLRIIRIEI